MPRPEVNNGSQLLEKKVGDPCLLLERKCDLEAVLSNFLSHNLSPYKQFYLFFFSHNLSLFGAVSGSRLSTVRLVC